MLGQFIRYFSNIAPLTKEEQEFIEQDTLISAFEKGDILLKEGQKATDNYFVLKGCIKQYVLKNGHENITRFYLPFCIYALIFHHSFWWLHSSIAKYFTHYSHD